MRASKTKILKKFIQDLLPFLLLLLGLWVITKLGYRITYVSSISMPEGWYWLVPTQKIQRYDMVAFTPPLKAQDFLTQRHWGPKSNQMMKYVMGIPGDFVCNYQQVLWINRQKIAPILRVYAPHQPLPQSNFCGYLKPSQYMLLSTKIEHSFDSRYFGPVERGNIIAKAIPIFSKKP